MFRWSVFPLPLVLLNGVHFALSGKRRGVQCLVRLGVVVFISTPPPFCSATLLEASGVSVGPAGWGALDDQTLGWKKHVSGERETSLVRLWFTSFLRNANLEWKGFCSCLSLLRHKNKLCKTGLTDGFPLRKWKQSHGDAEMVKHLFESTMTWVQISISIWKPGTAACLSDWCWRRGTEGQMESRVSEASQSGQLISSGFREWHYLRRFSGKPERKSGWLPAPTHVRIDKRSPP